jgi:hypothetical protein
MKRLSITIVIVFMVFTMACKRSSEIPAPGSQGSNSGTKQSAPASSQSSTVLPVPAAVPAQQAAPLTVSGSDTAKGMNPPHGQPNHRCDIAVGVPLDSPPGTGKTPPVTQQLNVPAQTATPSTVPATAPGMNPPHGQPGHRCDIAVGVPLDSPPGTGKQQTPPAAAVSPSTEHVHNQAESLSTSPIKIVPAPK